jgi:DNA-binding HxlR family transcriptional regulator
VEEIALGAVLRKLNEMPGIAKLDLDMGRGGEGAGRERLESAAVAPRGNNAQEIIKMLMDGPKHLNEMMGKLGGKKGSFYTSTSKLAKEGLLERGGSKGTWQLTARAKARLGAIKALPAPAAPNISRGPSGRATPGSGPIILRAALDAGPLTPTDLRAKLTEGGMSPKGVSGVLVRARKHGLIKKNGVGYELTAKGLKIEGASANG